MTLLDAPKFDEVRDRRNREILWISVAAVVIFIVGFWLVAGRPVDWPWNWYTHLRGRATINKFLDDVQRDDLPAAYGVWTHDPDWQKHPERTGSYPFSVSAGLEPTQLRNQYGIIKSHKIVAARMSGNVLLVGIYMNGLKSNALFLNYDPHTKQLGFSPVELYLGP